MRDALKNEKGLVVVFGSELRGAGCQGAGRLRTARRARSSSAWAITPIRAARQTWDFIPTCCRATPRCRARRSFHEDWLDEIPATPGLNLLQMVEAAKAGKLKALYVVGSNPVARYNIDPFALSKSFVVVQDMFLTETAAIADVVLPVANAYEKGGTYTNTSGDLQMLKKAGEFSGVRNDFECIVRIAAGMGYDVHKLVPFGGGGTRADMGQTRGAQSGEADRHAVWLTNHNLEPKMSPYDPDRHAGRNSATGAGIRHLAPRPALRPGRTYAAGTDYRRDRHWAIRSW